MKFGEIGKDQWNELKPYLDTCLLPVTGLTGGEAPWEAADKLERLRDIMDLVENPFKGRIVTYPAVQYLLPPGGLAEAVGYLCRKLKENGFRRVFVITADRSVAVLPFPDADLVLTAADGLPSREEVAALVSGAWNG